MRHPVVELSRKYASQLRPAHGRWRPGEVVALVTAVWFGAAAVIVAVGVFVRLVL